MNGKGRRGGAIVMFGLILATGCAAPSDKGLVEQQPMSPEPIIHTLQRQAEAWNAGNIDDFMQSYWRSPALTFSGGGRITRGWQATLEGYRQRYPTKDIMGRLTFSDFEVTMLGSEAALVLGRWHLDRDEPIGGVFSLVLRLQDGEWVIIHDHTSRDES